MADRISDIRARLEEASEEEGWQAEDGWADSAAQHALLNRAPADLAWLIGALEAAQDDARAANDEAGRLTYDCERHRENLACAKEHASASDAACARLTDEVARLSALMPELIDDPAVPFHHDRILVFLLFGAACFSLGIFVGYYADALYSFLPVYSSGGW